MDTMKKRYLLRTLGYVCVILGMSVASGVAYAGLTPPTSLGGGSLILVAVAAAMGVVAAIRKKPKK